MIKNTIEIIYYFFMNKVKSNDNYIFFESAYYIYDNTYALYRYIENNYKSKRLYYYCYKKEQYYDAVKKGLNKKKLLGIYPSNNLFVKLSRKVKNDYYIRKCGLAFCSYLMDIYKNRDNVKEKRKVVFLWHATLLFKSFNGGFAYHFPKKNNNQYFLNPTKATEKLYLESEPDIVNATFAIAGKPRNDLIYKPQNEAFKKLFGKRYKGEKVILCACTFRKIDSDPSDFFTNEFPLKLNQSDLEQLNTYLTKVKTILLIKAHHTQKVEGGQLLDNIVIKGQDDFTYNNIEVEEIFKMTSGLITDYSSIYLDYLLCNNPTAFFKCDEEQYSITRGFSTQKIMDMRIGYEVYNLEDLMNVIGKMVAGKDPFKKQKRQLSLLVNGNYGDNNCKSVCELFIK